MPCAVAKNLSHGKDWGMPCSVYREFVSADLDGELAADERWLLQQHLGGCRECRTYAGRSADLHRTLRVQPAPPVPDLTTAVLTRLEAPDGPGRVRRAAWRRSPFTWRLGLAAVGLLQLALAGPALITHPDLTEQQHVVHHLNAWTVAFAVGLLVVAWQPWRVRGVLPIASALAGVMLFTVVLDVRNDHNVAMPLTAHLLELAGLVLAWGLARQERFERGDPDRGGRGWWARRTGLPGMLLSVLPRLVSGPAYRLPSLVAILARSASLRRSSVQATDAGPPTGSARSLPSRRFFARATGVGASPLRTRARQGGRFAPVADVGQVRAGTTRRDEAPGTRRRGSPEPSAATA
jgi:predicted anti-sigma-YlaC factor YlaD